MVWDGHDERKRRRAICKGKQTPEEQVKTEEKTKRRTEPLHKQQFAMMLGTRELESYFRPKNSITLQVCHIF
jgi:hypothetical protein